MTRRKLFGLLAVLLGVRQSPAVFGVDLAIHPDVSALVTILHGREAIVSYADAKLMLHAFADLPAAAAAAADPIRVFMRNYHR